MTPFHRSMPTGPSRQRGVTLTELMIALVLGALVVLAATAMVVSSRGSYRTQDEGTRLAESARFGLELGDRLIRLAGYTNFGDDPTLPASYTQDPAWLLTPDAYALNGPNVVGANNSQPGGGAGINGSDALVVRFFGASPPNSVVADGNVLDCAGLPVPQAPLNANTVIANVSRSYNVLFVRPDTDGEPALMCTRQPYDPVTGKAGSIALPAIANDTQVLIRGVEDFQVLYGEAIPQPLPPNNDLDLYPPASLVYRTGIGGSNPVQNWNNVRSVRIAMLLRSAVGARTDPEPTSTNYDLFGPTYSGGGSADTGARFSLSGLSAAERTRMRRVVQTTVFIRNRMSDWPSLQAP